MYSQQDQGLAYLPNRNNLTYNCSKMSLSLSCVAVTYVLARVTFMHTS